MKKSEFSARYYKRTFTEVNGTSETETSANDAYTITVSNGNRKLLPDANVKYIIFNLLAIVTCPYATEHCKALCYARKAENNYPECKPCRDRNLKATKTAGFIPNMIDLIEYMIKLPSYKNGKKSWFAFMRVAIFTTKNILINGLQLQSILKATKSLFL